MKILMMSNVQPHQGSGSGITEYAYQLIAHAKPFLSREDSIKTIYALDKSKRNDIAGLMRSNTSFKRSIYKVLDDKYDIIHILDQEVGFAAKIIRKSGNDAKVITTIHDLSRLESRLHKGIAQKAYNWLVKGSVSEAVAYSDLILCDSTQTRDIVKEKFRKTPTLKVVPLGVDDKILTAKKSLKPKHEAFIIGYLGSFAYHKNVIFILEAAKHLKNKNRYKFEIYGTGVEMQNLVKFKNANSLSNVVLEGYAPEKEKVRIYDSFDAFVFPSLYEGFGLPILEAQARGLPVIIYKSGKIPTEVRRYCIKADDPADLAASLKHLKENGFNKKLAKTSTEYAIEFNWNKTAKDTIDAYAAVLK